MNLIYGFCLWLALDMKKINLWITEIFCSNFFRVNFRVKYFEPLNCNLSSISFVYEEGFWSIFWVGSLNLILGFVWLQFHQYQVVGRALPSETDEHPKIYRMKLWATNEVRAKSKFWWAFYFLLFQLTAHSFIFFEPFMISLDA